MDSPATSDLTTQCCVTGGGPAGLMLGYLLARAGVRVVVLEKHDDFLRDFRGDTIHPSTLTVLQDLGLLEDFLALPHQEISELSADVYGQAVTMAEILRRCDGQRTLDQIVDELAQQFTAEREVIAADVTAMLAELRASRLIVL